MKPEPWQQPTSRSCSEYAFITLNRLSCPSPSFSLKKSCSGYVRAMSRRITFSHAEVALMQSAYCFLTGESCAPQSSCQTIPRKWCGTPLRTSSCMDRHSDQLSTNHQKSQNCSFLTTVTQYHYTQVHFFVSAQNFNSVMVHSLFFDWRRPGPQPWGCKWLHLDATTSIFCTQQILHY